MVELVEIGIDGLKGVEGTFASKFKDFSILTGKNGAGKSSFLKAASILLKALKTQKRQIPMSFHKGNDFPLSPRSFEVSSDFFKEYINYYLTFQVSYISEYFLRVDAKCIWDEYSNNSINRFNNLKRYLRAEYTISLISKGSLDTQTVFSLNDSNSGDFGTTNGVTSTALTLGTMGEKKLPGYEIKVSFAPERILNNFNIKLETRDYSMPEGINLFEEDPEADKAKIMREFLKLRELQNHYKTEYKIDNHEYFEARRLLKNPHKKIKGKPRNQRNKKPSSIVDVRYFKKYESSIKSISKIVDQDLGGMMVRIGDSFNSLFEDKICSLFLWQKYNNDFVQLSFGSPLNNKENGLHNDEVEKKCKYEFDLLKKNHYGTSEEQILCNEFPELLREIEKHTYGLFPIEPISYDYSETNKFLPRELTLRLNSVNFKYSPNTATTDFINYWLKELEIGELLQVIEIEEEYSIQIVRKGGDVKLSSLSKGERNLVLLVLSIIANAYPKLGYYSLLNNMVGGDIRNEIIDLIKKEKEEYSSLLKFNIPYDEVTWNNAIPLLAECRNRNSIMYLEEPEANLHPNLQSRLVDLLIDANYKFGQRFIVETHSEYFIRKFQYMVGSQRIPKENVAVYYFDKSTKEKYWDLELNDNGTFSNDFGEGFYDESFRWKFELLQLNSLN